MFTCSCFEMVHWLGVVSWLYVIFFNCSVDIIAKNDVGFLLRNGVTGE